MFKNFNQSASQLAPSFTNCLASRVLLTAKPIKPSSHQLHACVMGPQVINCMYVSWALKSSTACMCHGPSSHQLHVCVMAPQVINCMYVSWALKSSTACMCHGPSSHQLHVWLLDLPSQQLHVCVMAAGSSISPQVSMYGCWSSTA